MVDQAFRTARSASELVRASVGIGTETLDPSLVPVELHGLIGDAEILGVGDDGTRDKIVESLPVEYMTDLNRRIGECSAPYREWMEKSWQGQTPPHEWIVFSWMEAALEYFDACHSEVTFL